ncbi:Sensor histidine kinase TmoS [Stieleria maiorica]|uniref:histidine kinase n=1 Tax=Stieleria maiorica TaxID=2795974 RepID=A0A5B9MBW8_9BACT|nr:HAMP domain-containing sensor histidine kinase [Stieleria maiorica]QEF98059.1 Sensor histidine kinase TmoS [Stieleria maiorica]
MPRRLFLALLLLVAAPMVLLGWMSATAVKASQAAAKENLATLLSSQLYDADRRIVQLFDNYAIRLDDELDGSDSVFETLRRMRRQVPILRQGIVVDPAGTIVFPRPGDSIGVDATEVAAALPGLVDARPLPSATGESQSPGTKVPAFKTKTAVSKTNIANAADSQSPRLKVSPQSTLTESAWQQWYMADGTQVVYWRARRDGSTVGMLLERSRWIADLIAVLPDHRSPESTSSLRVATSGTNVTPTKRALPDLAPTPIGSLTLVDEAKRLVYRWGNRDEFQLSPLAAAPLSAPLASWQLRLHVDPALVPSTSSVPMYLSLAGIAILLLAVGFYVLTSVQRQINEAKGRVSFAGQVSHELRTPLTNIRLYTELAESDLQRIGNSDAADSLAQRLSVIDHESRRLQRLVTGVLEMIRPNGKPLGVRLQSTDVGELIAGIAEQFTPSFKAAGLSLETDCRCHESVSVDPDIIEMVLVNLLSNVEKYVPRGGRCVIRCDLLPDETTTPNRLRVTVSDDGPGIAVPHQSRIFRPFVRIDDSIHAPSGTGIGLTIARRAAARHGGNLVLKSDSQLGGAAFELTVPIGE